MGRDVVTGRNVGLSLLGHLLAMVVLFFLALQGVVGATLPGGTRWMGVGAGPRAVRKVLKRTIGGWVASYQADLSADVADLREPLALLQDELDGDPSSGIGSGMADATCRMTGEDRPS